ncbi:hypothetical protein FA95DRAFT_1605552 [Auriscalpium vulgare]|uniref:Uncharacterized protein n=1 Tax=Auriscalpium vulgare TaxID=40419 RepID=A0ACB8RWD7_9AGAM|nr:hypothetical protein FA95DRAFT_1605552 [Auriscalpium vulgare]
MLPLDVAALASLLSGSILYGVHVVTFTNAVKVLLFKKRRRARRPILIVATFMFFLYGTLFAVVAFLWVLDAFVLYKGPGGPTAKLLQISGVVPRMVAIPLTAQMLVGDAMWIYRCFVLHRKNWMIVALPILCWLGTAILSISIVIVTANTHEAATISDMRLRPMILSHLSLTVTVNTFCTSMIVYKVWRMERRVLNFLGDGLTPRLQYGQIITVLVESTAMYSICALLLLVLEVLKNNAAYIIYHSIIEIAGIAFDLVTIRIAEDRSVEAHFTAATVGAGDPIRFATTQTTVGEMTLRDMPAGSKTRRSSFHL